MRSTIISAGSAGIAILLVHGSSAHAVTCDTLTLTNLAEDVIIGEVGYEQCFGGPDPGCFFMPYLTPRLGACVLNPDGSEDLYVLDCTTSHTTSDNFQLYASGGNDRVAVLKDQHTIGDLTLLPAGGGVGAMYCGDDGDAIAPWHPDFDFKIWAYLGAGKDLYHGSDGVDAVYTNALALVNTGSGFVLTHPADGASDDQACGWGGNDGLYGDRDDNYSTAEDRLDGGAGTDTCDGDLYVDGNDVSDLYENCETVSDAYSDAVPEEINCAASDDPIHEW